MGVLTLYRAAMDDSSVIETVTDLPEMTDDELMAYCQKNHTTIFHLRRKYGANNRVMSEAETRDVVMTVKTATLAARNRQEALQQKAA